jgi:hypothetical protein
VEDDLDDGDRTRAALGGIGSSYSLAGYLQILIVAALLLGAFRLIQNLRVKRAR